MFEQAGSCKDVLLNSFDSYQTSKLGQNYVKLCQQACDGIGTGCIGFTASSQATKFTWCELHGPGIHKNYNPEDMPEGASWEFYQVGWDASGQGAIVTTGSDSDRNCYRKTSAGEAPASVAPPCARSISCDSMFLGGPVACAIIGCLLLTRLITLCFSLYQSLLASMPYYLPFWRHHSCCNDHEGHRHYNYNNYTTYTYNYNNDRDYDYEHDHDNDYRSVFDYYSVLDYDHCQHHDCHHHHHDHHACDGGQHDDDVKRHHFHFHDYHNHSVRRRHHHRHRQLNRDQRYQGWWHRHASARHGHIRRAAWQKTQRQCHCCTRLYRPVWRHQMFS